MLAFKYQIHLRLEVFFQVYLLAEFVSFSCFQHGSFHLLASNDIASFLCLESLIPLLLSSSVLRTHMITWYHLDNSGESPFFKASWIAMLITSAKFLLPHNVTNFGVTSGNKEHACHNSVNHRVKIQTLY